MEKNNNSIILKTTDGDKENNIALEYISYYDIYNDESITKLSLLGRALSVPIRIAILREINNKPTTLSDIAKTFSIQISSAAFHVQALIDAELVIACDSKHYKGHTKWLSYGREKLILIKLRELLGINKIKEKQKIKEIGVGEFIDLDFRGNSGMATENELIIDKDKNKFFCNERKDIQIIWTDGGHITYPIENNLFAKHKIDSIEISLELCSEARGYNENYPSDITFRLNDKELCTYTCPGDFGDRYGKYTPDWWFPESTKYGLLTIITIRHDGVYLNGQKVNKNVTCASFDFTKKNYSTFTIMTKEDAINNGGFNIFGEKFGDYNQSIKIVVNYKED